MSHDEAEKRLREQFQRSDDLKEAALATLQREWRSHIQAFLKAAEKTLDQLLDNLGDDWCVGSVDDLFLDGIPREPRMWVPVGSPSFDLRTGEVQAPAPGSPSACEVAHRAAWPTP